MNIDKKYIEKEVKNLDPKVRKTDDAFKVACILLAGLQVGADVKKIAAFLEIPTKDVKKYEDNLRVGKVWEKGKTSCEWFEKHGAIAFWLDVLVAQGLLDRAEEQKKK